VFLLSSSVRPYGLRWKWWWAVIYSYLFVKLTWIFHKNISTSAFLPTSVTSHYPSVLPIQLNRQRIAILEPTPQSSRFSSSPTYWRPARGTTQWRKLSLYWVRFTVTIWESVTGSPWIKFLRGRGHGCHWRRYWSWIVRSMKVAPIENCNPISWSILKLVRCLLFRQGRQ